MSSVTQPQETHSSFFTDLQRVLRQNIRQYGMFIALFVIWIFFAVATNGLFLDAQLKTVSATGDPKQMLAHPPNPRVHAFLTRSANTEAA